MRAMTEGETRICGLAIASLVLAIIAYLSSWLIIGLLFAIPSVICGHLALARIRRAQGAVAGKPLAIIGLVVGYVSIVMSILVAIGLALVLMFAYQPSQEVAKREAEIAAVDVSHLTHDQKMWIWATCALITESNVDRHDVFGGAVPTLKEIEQQKRALREWWGVHDRKSLLSTLDWLWREGHRKDFESLGSRIQSLDSEQLQAMKDKAKYDPKLLNRIAVVEKYYTEMGPKSIYGWDYARYVALCGWGYLVGYLSEKEAWQHALPAALVLQIRFDSWEDLGRNYLVGREFWSLEETNKTGDRYRQSYIKLTTDPLSPWKKYPWDLGFERVKYEQLVQLHPDYAVAYYNRGIIYYDKGDYDQAISDYNQAITLDPKYAVAYHNRGLTYKNKGDYDKAISDYDQAIRLDPQDTNAYNSRGVAYKIKGNYDQAISDYNQAIKIDPNCDIAYSNLGSIYCDKKGDYDQAIAYFNKAIEINPNYATAYYNRGNAYKNKGDYDLAISNYSQTIRLDPKYAGAYCNRAAAYYHQHEYEKAWEDVRKAESLGHATDPKFLEDLKKASGQHD